MTITIDARMLNKSGIGRYLRLLLPELLAIESNTYTLLGYEQELAAYKGLSNVRIVPMLSSIYDPREQFELKKKIPVSDIYFSPHFITPYFRIPAKKRITTIHDVYHLSEFGDYSALKKLYSRILFQNAVRKSDLILTVSEFSKSEIKRLLHSGDKEIRVVYNCIRPNQFPAFDPADRNIAIQSVRCRFGFDENTSFFLFVGNVKPQKNLRRLVEGFRMVPDPNLRLLIVGKREGFIAGVEDSDQWITRDPRISFTGPIDDKELIQLYNAAEFTAFPSVYEGFGLPPLESMSCGTAAIVSDIPVIREVCGDAALYFDPLSPEDIAKKIEFVHSDSALRNDLVGRGFERIALFKPESFIDRHLELFR